MIAGTPDDLMKKCTYCGAEYPDEAVTCSIDQEPLKAVGVVAETEEAGVPMDSTGNPIQFNEETGLPVGFERFVVYDSYSAVKLFWQMEREGIVFWAEKLKEEREADNETKAKDQFTVFVRKEDLERALKMCHRGEGHV
ncbi:MAG TPA: hypothetical protein VH413_06990 [Verrucomicrobiae bacterium]|jgi:hypothetical protein|nr:hypothetical protein [Verrucomicrobiae bacterium]